MEQSLTVAELFQRTSIGIIRPPGAIHRRGQLIRCAGNTISPARDRMDGDTRRGGLSDKLQFVVVAALFAAAAFVDKLVDKLKFVGQGLSRKGHRDI